MVERVEAVEITVTIITNKESHEERFDDIENARDWLESILSEIGGE